MLWLESLAPPMGAWALHDADHQEERRAELEALQGGNEKLRNEVNGLSRRIEALRTDPRFLEKVAREELGWIRDGEVVYRVAVE